MKALSDEGYGDRLCPSHDCICLHIHKEQPDGTIPDGALSRAKRAESSPAFGPEKAQVEIVEFSDFQCPFCNRVTPTLEQINTTQRKALQSLIKSVSAMRAILVYRFAQSKTAEMLDKDIGGIIAIRAPIDYYPMAVDKVRFVGEPVVMVAAGDRYTAEDALDVIEVEYDPLPPVVDPLDALDDGAPLVHEAHAMVRRYDVVLSAAKDSLGSRELILD